MHESNYVQEKDAHKLFSDFEIKMNHQTPVRHIDMVSISNQKRICHQVNSTIQVINSIKKRKEKKNKYKDLARELKRLNDINVTVITYDVVSLSMLPKRM